MNATKRDLIGRKITAINWNRFRTERAGGYDPWTTDPILTLDNGRKVWFTVEETEVGDYGVRICIGERRTKQTR